MKRENRTGPRTDPCGTAQRDLTSDFCDFQKPMYAKVVC